MRVLFSTQPAMGHFRPLVPLARALAARGDEVFVACAKSFAPEVEKCGLRALPAGFDFTIGAASAAFPDMPPAGPARMPWMIPFWCKRTALAMVPDLERIVDDVRPDLLVREYLEYGAAFVGEKRGIVHVVAGPVWFRGEPIVESSLAEACLELGLPAERALKIPFAHATYAAMPPEWVAPDEIVPEGVRYVRPEAPETRVAPSPSSAFGKRVAGDARPVVHLTLGTTEANRTPGLYRLLIDAIRTEPVKLVVSMGRDFLPEEVGPPAENVVVERYVDHSELLPACDLVVSNGGYGTLMAALEHGLPSLVVPIQADQPRNARRCVDLGFAEAVARPDWNVDSIRASLRKVLGNAGYRESAARIGENIRSLPRVGELVDEIVERVVTSRPRSR